MEKVASELEDWAMTQLEDAEEMEEKLASDWAAYNQDQMYKLALARTMTETVAAISDSEGLRDADWGETMKEAAKLQQVVVKRFLSGGGTQQVVSAPRSVGKGLKPGSLPSLPGRGRRGGRKRMVAQQPAQAMQQHATPAGTRTSIYDTAGKPQVGAGIRAPARPVAKAKPVAAPPAKQRAPAAKTPAAPTSGKAPWGTVAAVGIPAAAVGGFAARGGSQRSSPQYGRY
jgi:hypothetical protein